MKYCSFNTQTPIITVSEGLKNSSNTASGVPVRISNCMTGDFTQSRQSSTQALTGNENPKQIIDNTLQCQHIFLTKNWETNTFLEQTKMTFCNTNWNTLQEFLKAQVY